MLSLSMMLGMFSTSCEDMLSPDSERHAYTVAEDTLYSYWGILRSLQDIAERYVILNECRGDFVDASSFVSDTIAAIVDFGEGVDPEKWKDGACAYLRISDYYHVINSCNAYIAKCDTNLVTGINQPYMLKEYSQVQAIRAWVYMQLLYAYGPNRVPFFTEPMLATNDITNFMADKNKRLVNSQILVEEFGSILERMEEVEKQYGLPQYNSYGNPTICHSSKCMFPVSLVLGDLYLLNNQYADAALHYFNFLKSKNGGPLVVANYYSIGDLDDRLDYPIYNWFGNPYRETGAVSRGTEAITVIPSNTGKLDGRVLTDINRLFGFQAEMRSSKVTSVITVNGEQTESTSDNNYVVLSSNYERELIPSKGYEALCDSQKYEIYIGTKPNSNNWDNFVVESIEELPGVGDARRAWIYSTNGEQWNFRVGDDILYGKMVTKQNPNGSFSTGYPVIYRKSSVWLRYAEALNRAGFPGYAFAILKCGLCDNKVWFPSNPQETYKNNMANSQTISIANFYTSEDGRLQLIFNEDQYDYPITEAIFCYCVGKDEKGHDILLPEGWNTDNRINNLTDLIAWYRDYAKTISTEDEEGEDTGEDDELDTLTDYEVFEKIYKDVRLMPASEDAFANTPAIPSYRARACYFLDRRELERAANTPYLNIAEISGQEYYQRIFAKEQGKLFRSEYGSFRFSSAEDPTALYTIGVHQRGCGFIRWDDPEEFRSSYNYVDQVKKKIKETTGKEVTEDDIYSGKYDAEVQDAVEDLIIDECGLELAFEGSRFSDLYRVAMRRGNPDYLAERVSKRHTGEVDPKLRSWLNNMSHWFLPLPVE